ncbi:hypothetical protein C8T65DRAFT_101345 [Cerioporus squamosus]|nr:hypothetical protein C8T65DRAFT_101345 [Cerioporus squamosus]
MFAREQGDDRNFPKFHPSSISRTTYESLQVFGSTTCEQASSSRKRVRCSGPKHGQERLVIGERTGKVQGDAMVGASSQRSSKDVVGQYVMSMDFCLPFGSDSCTPLRSLKGTHSAHVLYVLQAESTDFGALTRQARTGIQKETRKCYWHTGQSGTSARQFSHIGRDAPLHRNSHVDSETTVPPGTTSARASDAQGPSSWHSDSIASDRT